MLIMKKQKSYQIIGRNGTMNKLGKGNEQSVFSILLQCIATTKKGTSFVEIP